MHGTERGMNATRNHTCSPVGGPWSWWDGGDPRIRIANACSWPWKQLSPDQWLELAEEYQRLTTYGDVFSTLFRIDYFLCAVGILGNLLSLLTLFKGKFDQPSYAYHKVLAGCDLLFNALFLVHAYGHLNNQVAERYYFFTVLRIAVKGPAFSLSAASDFIGVAIAFERMVGVCFPVRYAKINTKRFAYSMICMAITLGFLCGIRYSLINTVSPKMDPISNETIYEYVYNAFSDTPLCYYWQMTADAVVPFVIMALMCPMSIFTAIAIVKRFLKKRKTRVHQPTGQPNNAERGGRLGTQQTDQMRSATELLVASTLMCVMSQSGGIVYTITLQVAWNLMDVGFDHSFDHFALWLYRIRVYNVGYVLSGLLGNLTHVMHFYVYVLISSSFRKAFLGLIKRTSQTSNSVGGSNITGGGSHAAPNLTRTTGAIERTVAWK